MSRVIIQSLPAVKHLFEQWKRDHGEEYAQAYCTLTIPDILAPFVRLEVRAHFREFHLACVLFLVLRVLFSLGFDFVEGQFISATAKISFEIFFFFPSERVILPTADSLVFSRARRHTVGNPTPSVTKCVNTINAITSAHP